MLKSYEYRLYPNKEQQVLIQKHFGCNRFVYNKALALKIESYEKTGKSPSKYDLSKLITTWKQEEQTSWLKEVDSQSLQQSMTDLDSAFIKFFREKKGFPKFKSKKLNRKSYRLPQRTKIDFENKKVFISKLKNVNVRIDRTFEGLVKSCTVKQSTSGKYFISMLVEDGLDYPEKLDIEKDKSVGIDLGLKDFVVLSDGTKIKNPKTLKNNLIKLKVLQRRLSRKVVGSSNRNKARIVVAKQHEKIRNIRKDFLQKLSTSIINDNQINTICLETLNISGMLKNHKLAQAISDVSWSEFVRMLEYKAEWTGKNILRIGRFEPSSKLCNCGQVNNELTLKDRTWTCKHCGLTHDRDILAANNIKNIAFAHLNKKIIQDGVSP